MDNIVRATGPRIIAGVVATFLSWLVVRFVFKVDPQITNISSLVLGTYSVLYPLLLHIMSAQGTT